MARKILLSFLGTEWTEMSKTSEVYSGGIGGIGLQGLDEG